MYNFLWNLSIQIDFISNLITISAAAQSFRAFTDYYSFHMTQLLCELSFLQAQLLAETQSDVFESSIISSEITEKLLFTQIQLFTETQSDISESFIILLKITERLSFFSHASSFAEFRTNSHMINFRNFRIIILIQQQLYRLSV